MKTDRLETATFGAGCFWGVEDAFSKIRGVKETTVGYMGGDFPNPTYKDVCGNKTAHAEVAQLKYDPAEVSYEKLLKVFWKIHDPTTPNSQGPDYGSQYRSIFFFHTPEQEALAKKSKEELEKSGKFKNSVATEIMPAAIFWRAEEYHQNILRNLNQNQKILKTEDEWKKELTPEQYKTLREKRTEAPFSGKYYLSREKGVYKCAACGNELFSSDAKFESGTGWPSFCDVLRGAVELKPDMDLGTQRIETICARCGSHLGHVFDDGPRPTSKRYCINSLSLNLEKRAQS